MIAVVRTKEAFCFFEKEGLLQLVWFWKISRVRLRGNSHTPKLLGIGMEKGVGYIDEKQS